jgi:hypothetical protein
VKFWEWRLVDVEDLDDEVGLESPYTARSLCTCSISRHTPPWPGHSFPFLLRCQPVCH